MPAKVHPINADPNVLLIVATTMVKGSKRVPDDLRRYGKRYQRVKVNFVGRLLRLNPNASVMYDWLGHRSLRITIRV